MRRASDALARVGPNSSRCWSSTSSRQAQSKGAHMSTRTIVDEYFRRLAQKSDWSACLADDMVFTSFTAPNKRVDGRTAYLEATKRFYSTIVAVNVKDVVVDGTKACALTHYDLQAPGMPA